LFNSLRMGDPFCSFYLHLLLPGIQL
jgi:hypothetical protein